MRFAHIRVGNRNVKSIYSDGDDAVWVGTSGGVVRYDLKDDSYENIGEKIQLGEAAGVAFRKRDTELAEKFNK